MRRPKLPMANIRPVSIPHVLSRGLPAVVLSPSGARGPRSVDGWSLCYLLGSARVEGPVKHSSQAAGTTPGDPGGDIASDAPLILDFDDPADALVMPDDADPEDDPVMRAVVVPIIPDVDAPIIADCHASAIPDADAPVVPLLMFR